MRIGLFGGTFDPIHLGHLILAESCRESARLDRVLFIPAGSPPHKKGDRTPVRDRIEMVRIAIAGHPNFEVSEVEANRPGPHYSIETIEEIRRERPGDELFFLIGADSLVDLPHWREPDRIRRAVGLIVVNRPGVVAPEPTAALSPMPDALPVLVVEVPPIGIASSDLRLRVAEGRSVRYQTPRGVEVYVRENGLYRDRVETGC